MVLSRTLGARSRPFTFGQDCVTLPARLLWFGSTLDLACPKSPLGSGGSGDAHGMCNYIHVCVARFHEVRAIRLGSTKSRHDVVRVAIVAPMRHGHDGEDL